MAKLQPGLDFTGTIQNLVFYKRKDIDQIIVRTKGTLSKKKISKFPSFEPTRQINREFGVRARFSGMIVRSMRDMKNLSDYNMAPSLNALLKPVQEMDTAHEKGSRSVQLSRAPGKLEGFPLNKRNVFDSVVRLPLNVSISKEKLSAVIETPVLSPKLDFFPVDNYPVFRWQACLLALPDLNFQEHAYKPSFRDVHYTGEWHSVSDGATSEFIELSLHDTSVFGNISLLLVVGIGFGTVRSGGPEAVKYAGCGKVVKGN